ncbi:MAG TPA: hypothetical protein VGF50_00195 [Caulobacteraceae bacterium]
MHAPIHHAVFFSLKRFTCRSQAIGFARAAPRADRRGRAPAWGGAVCALMACVFVFPGRAPAQSLWRGLEVGASVNRVRQSFPDATQPLSVTTLADGETDDLTTHGLFLGDRLMEVRFFFRDNALTSVQLAPVAIGAQTRVQNLQLASDLAGRLSARYGAPFDCGDKSYADVDTYACKWLQGPIIVRLWYLDAHGQAPTLRIAFRKADDAAYDF